MIKTETQRKCLRFLRAWLKRGKAEEALQRIFGIMRQLKLTVNEEKTRTSKIPEGEFDCLGDTFERMYSARTGKARLGCQPSKKSIRRMVEKVYALTAYSMSWLDTMVLVNKLSRMLRGWANYFQVRTVNRAYRALDSYTVARLRQWLRHKDKVRNLAGGGYPPSYLYENLGFVRLTRLGCDVSWVKA